MPKVLVARAPYIDVRPLQQALGRARIVVRNVTSGELAIERLAEEPHDAVIVFEDVGDRSGVELLTDLRRRHPDVARVAITEGPPENRTRMRRIAHQFLPRTADPTEVVRAIFRSLAVCRLLGDRGLADVIGRGGRPGAFPHLYAQVAAELESDDPSLRRVGDIVERDPGMTARLLQTVNSPYFGVRREVSDVHLAVNLLGGEQVMSLILTVHVFSNLEAAAAGASLEALYRHALAVGAAARLIVEQEGGTREEAAEAMSAGMLHDLGRLTLAEIYPDRYRELVAQAPGRDGPALERHIFGATHAEVGAYLLASWDMPLAIVEAAAYHHRPSKAAANDLVLAAVHVADVHNLESPIAPREAGAPTLDANFLAGIGAADKVGLWEAVIDGEAAA